MFGLLQTHRLIFDHRCDVGGISSFAFRPARPGAARAGQHGILGSSATAMKPFSPADPTGQVPQQQNGTDHDHR